MFLFTCSFYISWNIRIYICMYTYVCIYNCIHRAIHFDDVSCLKLLLTPDTTYFKDKMVCYTCMCDSSMCVHACMCVCTCVCVHVQVMMVYTIQQSHMDTSGIFLDKQ